LDNSIRRDIRILNSAVSLQKAAKTTATFFKCISSLIEGIIDMHNMYLRGESGPRDNRYEIAMVFKRAINPVRMDVRRFKETKAETEPRLLTHLLGGEEQEDKLRA